MAKKGKTVWFCSECGNESPKWMGRCPSCGEWNTMVEETITTSNIKQPLIVAAKQTPVPLDSLDVSGESRVSLNNAELDRLLGGGLVEGSLVLIGGEPGIGKSTLSLQIPLSCPNLKTLYVTGEESVKQVKLRATRLGDTNCSNCYIYSETLMENIIEEAKKTKPDLMVVDSVQTMYSNYIESSPGSVSQIKETAALLLRFAKETNIPVILIGHITKEGSIAGPKILEHIVDVVLQFEGDNRGAYRLLRGIKNRFGSTSELAVFRMTGNGLVEVPNPSEMLVPMHEESLSGTSVGAMLDGTRPFLIEVQALVSTAAYGTPQRSATGFDTRRLNMLLAVLEKRAGFKLGIKDVFLNMAGGLKINDPACDLAIVVAILSSNFDFAIPSNICFAGELGLSGEIRPVAQLERRIAEAARLKYRQIYISGFANLDFEPEGIEVVKVSDITALCRKLMK